jgi:hypothetical protein
LGFKINNEFSEFDDKPRRGMVIKGNSELLRDRPRLADLVKIMGREDPDRQDKVGRTNHLALIKDRGIEGLQCNPMPEAKRQQTNSGDLDGRAENRRSLYPSFFHRWVIPGGD